MRINGWLVEWWMKFHVNKCEMRHAEKTSGCHAYEIMGFDHTTLKQDLGVMLVSSVKASGQA